jgi:hypothetical protein
MTDTLPVLRAGQLQERPQQERWLFNPIWGHCAAGIVGGIPKLGKSWFGLDLAISVASDTPALDRFPPEQTGPALVYLAEDSLGEIRARIAGYCAHRRLEIATLDVHVITAPVLRLDLLVDRQRLLATVQAVRPRLLLLDPLVRLHRLNENDASDISGLLGFLRELQRTFDMAVILTHHQSKRACTQPGQALRGSSDLHAFGDSNAYLARHDDGQLLLTLEHRTAPAPQPIRLRLVSHADGSATHLEALPPAENKSTPPPLGQRVLDALRQAGQPLPQAALRRQLQVNNQRLGELLQDMLRRAMVLRTSDGWTVPTPTQPALPETGA